MLSLWICIILLLVLMLILLFVIKDVEKDQAITERRVKALESLNAINKYKEE